MYTLSNSSYPSSVVIAMLTIHIISVASHDLASNEYHQHLTGLCRCEGEALVGVIWRLLVEQWWMQLRGTHQYTSTFPSGL